MNISVNKHYTEPLNPCLPFMNNGRDKNHAFACTYKWHLVYLLDEFLSILRRDSTHPIIDPMSTSQRFDIQLNHYNKVVFSTFSVILIKLE